MFRPLRRFKQALSQERCEEILCKGSYGVLAVLGDEGYPYTVPLNYHYCGGRIYFHTAASGHKLDAVRGCDKVSFCVVDKDELVAEKLTTYFRSVVVFGRIRIIEDTEEKRAAVVALSRRYFPHMEEKIQKEASGTLKNLCMLELSIEHMSGKEAIELVQQKGEG